MDKTTSTIKKRAMTFTNRTVTRIWQEEPAADNPFLAATCRCHGYDILDLAQQRSFVEVLFLLFQGELPDQEQAALLETLLISLINPGPRHPATRAAMNAGVGKTNTSHILPIGLSILGGNHLGGEEVVQAMGFLKRSRRDNPAKVATELLSATRPDAGDWHIAPGFGSRFGGIDPQAREIAHLLTGLPGNKASREWGQTFAHTLADQAMGWLSTGIAAAVFCDLGFPPRAGAGLFQLLGAPGILAHGLELANKPITEMPFLNEEQYVIAPTAQKR